MMTYRPHSRQFGSSLITMIFGLSAIVGAGALAGVATADSNPLYWHYTPLDSFTHGLGLSQPDGDRVSPWQARINVGYGLDSVGAGLQRNQNLVASEPAWYLATGARVRHYFQEESDAICLFTTCNRPVGEWEGAIYSRWSWGYAGADARLDMGYGAEVVIRQDAQSERLMWSLRPTLDVTLGWSL